MINGKNDVAMASKVSADDAVHGTAHSHSMTEYYGDQALISPETLIECSISYHILVY